MNNKRTKETQKMKKNLSIYFFKRKLLLNCTINKQKIDKIMNNTKIELTEVRLEKNPNTKTTFNVVSESTEVITEQNYKNIISDDWVKYMRRLGGVETITRGYTSAGYLVTRLVSTSPNKQNKTIREFSFIEDKRYK